MELIKGKRYMHVEFEYFTWKIITNLWTQKVKEFYTNTSGFNPGNR